MKITNIAYEQLYPTGVYANQRYRVEVTLGDDDVPEAAFHYAKEIVEKTFTALNPQINWNETKDLGVYENFVSETKPRDTVDNIIEDIRSCKEIKVLESYKLIAKTNHRIQEAFDNKMKNLKHEHL